MFDDTGIAIDTGVHEIELVADTVNSRFLWSLDNTAYVAVTADIPADTQVLNLVWILETAENVAKNIDIYYIDVETDK